MRERESVDTAFHAAVDALKIWASVRLGRVGIRLERKGRKEEIEESKIKIKKNN